MKKNKFLLIVFFMMSGCAIMYHTQVGEVDSNIVLDGQRFEIKVSELGFNVDELVDIGSKVAKAMQNDQAAKHIKDVNTILGFFQIGPRTGNPTFTDQYADKIYYSILEKCLSGRVSGLTSVREMAKYPVISGEVVKIIGFCK